MEKTEPNTSLVKVETEADMDTYNNIMIEVFHIGQKISKEAVLDQTGDLTFFLFKADDEVVGALRHNKKDLGYKIERVAILSKHRRKGYGKTMIDLIVAEIKKIKAPEDKIFSYIQFQTKSFYLRCNFEVDTEHPMVIQNIEHYKAFYKEG